MMRVILVLMLAVLAWRVVEHHRSRSVYVADSARRAAVAAAPAVVDPPVRPAILPAETAAAPGAASAFRCDGRTMCSQMHSCEEAKYFLQNCPGTKMDGDHDGVPCEQQWCTGR